MAAWHSEAMQIKVLENLIQQESFVIYAYKVFNDKMLLSNGSAWQNFIKSKPHIYLCVYNKSIINITN